MNSARALQSMKDYKEQFDIFICGGSPHVHLLLPLLNKLRPYGRVHLVSSFLSAADLHQLAGLYDILIEPRHSDDGYRNFELFCIRDINRLATAPYFIKLDADVQLQPDWIEYVEESITAHPDAVLFGSRRGNNLIDFTLSGELVRQVLETEVRISNALKVGGGFYAGKTSFFKKHLRVMDVIHEFMWCFKDGVRFRPHLNPEYWPAAGEESEEPITLIGQSKNFEGNEDTLRSLVVHAMGAGDRLHVIDSHGRVQVVRTNTMNPDAIVRQSETQTRQSL